jgi:serine/threonine protein kinase
VASVEREVSILHSLRHPRVLNLMGVCQDMSPLEGNLGLVFELMSGGSLHDLLHGATDDVVARRAPTDLLWKLSVCLDIAEGVGFLHRSLVLHRDLKSANVLLDREGRAKIADFGLSTWKDSTVTQTAGVVATPAWTDPEVLKGAKKHSEASDMYSFGVIVWEVFSGEVPWAGESLMRVMFLTGCEGQRLVIRDSFPAPVKELLVCSFKESTERPTFSSVVRLFGDLINDQYALQGRYSMPSPLSSEERLRQIVRESMEGAMGELSSVVESVVGQHVAPLQEGLARLEGQVAGLRAVFGEMQEELLALNDAEGLSELRAFWTTRMDRLEALVLSSSCDEAKIVKEMRIIGNSLTNEVLELDLKVDPDALTRELTKARDELVKVIAADNEAALGDLLEELRRMILAE